MSPHRFVERREDMSPDGRLRLILQPDGDVIVCVVASQEDRLFGGLTASVEFCSLGAGGGRSSNTIRALRELAKAMERDNTERPL
jgi:hypothetical protein